METVQEKTILSEEQGKELFYAATKLAVEKYRQHTLTSEADFFSGVMFVLQELSESPEEDLLPYLIGPAMLLMSGRGLIKEHFDQRFRAEVNRTFRQNGAMAHYRLSLHSGLTDIVRFLEPRRPDMSVAREIARSLLEEVFEEYDYADDE